MTKKVDTNETFMSLICSEKANLDEKVIIRLLEETMNLTGSYFLKEAYSKSIMVKDQFVNDLSKAKTHAKQVDSINEINPLI